MPLLDKLHVKEEKLGAVLDKVSSGIPAHGFCSALHLWSVGKITRTQIVNAYGLDASDQADLDKLETFYNSLSASERPTFKDTLESVLILREEGKLTDQQTITLLGLS